MMNNSDLARIINSDEIQTKVRAAREGFAKPSQKRNPLKNLGSMLKLNPFISQVRRAEIAQAAVGAGKKRKLAPTDAKEKSKKLKTKKAARRLATDAKLTQRAKYGETLRATPETPCTSFLNSYNKVEEAIDKGVKAKK